MTVTQTPTGYRMDFDAREREQLMTAVEYALSVLRLELDGARMLGDLDGASLDELADRLFLVEHLGET